MARATRLADIISILRGEFPFSYLGVPLFCGTPKAVHLWLIIHKITHKFAKWIGNSLSIAGRIVLVHRLLFTHSFAIYKWPTSLIRCLETAIRNFIWTWSIDKKKIVSAPWSLCLKPIAAGGLRLRNIHDVNVSLLAKFAWNLISNNNMCFQLLQNRFLICLDSFVD